MCVQVAEELHASAEDSSAATVRTNRASATAVNTEDDFEARMRAQAVKVSVQ